uniref:BRCT domain-containing protein n=1 Tax=Periophthalmus magnuspinnatus TaxID=409849 RepID=A0A3B4AJ05_9GOBI
FRMAENRYIFQISGIKKPELKKCLTKGIRKLGGRYIGGSVYQHSSTHFIVPQVLPSEKFLAACAAGKWVVTPNYVLDSVKNGSWLPEESYEVAISTSTTSTFYPVRQWRERVASGKLKGAFQGWRVLLMVQKPHATTLKRLHFLLLVIPPNVLAHIESCVSGFEALSGRKMLWRQK